MTATAPDRLAGELQNLIRGMPGVAAIYPSSLLGAAITAASRAWSASGQEVLVVVGQDRDTTTVTVTIGVAADAGAAATCRAVHDAIAARLRADRRQGTITVTVAQVAEQSNEARANQ